MVRHASRPAHGSAADLRAARDRGPAAQESARRKPLLAGGQRTLSRSLLAALLLAGCGGTGKQLRRADGYLDDGRYKAAARTYDDVLERKPDNERALLGAAEAWSLAEEAELAIARAEAARRLGLAGADEALARAWIAVGRGAEARDLLAGASGDGAMLLAEAHLAAGEPQQGLDALARSGASPQAQVLGAWLRWRAQGPEGCEEATTQARSAARAAYEDPEILADAAAVLRACQDLDGSAELARQARTFHLDGSAPYRQLAARRTAGGDDEGGARLMARATALYPEEGGLARDLGAIWYQAGEPRLAVQELLRALPLAPYQQDLTRPDIIVGAFGMETAERQEAVQELWTTLAVALEAAGDARNAVAARERALILDPAATADSWADLALAWSKAGDQRKAEEAGHKALQLDGANARMWLVLADITYAAGRMDEATGLARRAWEIDPGDPAIAVRLAEAALRSGAAAEARRVVESALRDLKGAVHPLSPRLHALLAEATKASGG